MPAIITIRDGRSTASIAPEFGFNCFAFRADTGAHLVDVLDSDPKFATEGGRASGNGIPILFPFPNRIAGGKYQWDGREYEIPTRGSHAIHGFVLDTPWRVVEQSERSITGEWQLSRDAADRAALWPTDCRIRVSYELRGPTLHSRIVVSNPATKPMPWGFGTHAYFKLPLVPGSSVEHCLIQAPVHQQWVLEDFIPTGERIPIPEGKDIHQGAYVRSAKFDDVFTDVRTESDTLDCTIVDEESGLRIVQRCPKHFREVVVYTPPNRDAVCMEPYTCTTDAINLEQRGVDAGWRTLEPGGEFETWIDITVESAAD